MTKEYFTEEEAVQLSEEVGIFDPQRHVKKLHAIVNKAAERAVREVAKDVEPVFYALRNKNGLCTWKSPSLYPETQEQLEFFNKGFPNDAPFENVALFTAPPSTALAVELAIRKCAEVCKVAAREFYKAHDSAMYTYKAEACEDMEHEILALLEPPPSLETYLRE